MPGLVTYRSGEATIHAERWSPAGAKPRGSVVIAHGTDGVTDHLNGPWAATMRGFGDALAARGFAVLLPYYFEKTGTDPGPPAMQSMFGHMAVWQQALADAVTSASSGGAGGVALVGFSMGGHLSLRLCGSVPVIVKFFAPFLTGLSPARGGGIQPRIQIHHGKADSLVDAGNAQHIATVLNEEGTSVDLHSYAEAGHGFGGGKSGDEAALKLSRKRTVSFIAAAL